MSRLFHYRGKLFFTLTLACPCCGRLRDYVVNDRWIIWPYCTTCPAFALSPPLEMGVRSVDAGPLKVVMHRE